MTYSETCEYLYTRTPLFSKTGASAYKPGLATTLALDAHLGHPHRQYQTVHIGGTNGKGSTSHTVAAILQSAGYRIGLFTSPHLLDFRERIRVNGEMCSQEFVVDFVEKHRSFFEPLHPSFFEVTTAMALTYFAEQKVDIAVIEVGLGGRLDCTNIITPVLSAVTNISLDHTDLLGHTLSAIASEKAGIIKPGIPFILGESTTETLPVFREKTQAEDSPLILAEEYTGELPQGELQGDCQQANMRTILTIIRELQSRTQFTILPEHIYQGIHHVCKLTGLRGRWEKISENPQVLCDVGHNPGAWQYLGPRLTEIARSNPLFIIIGMCCDKDVDTVLSMMPPSAHYIWTQADSNRALPAEQLAHMALQHHLTGRVVPSVSKAYQCALAEAMPQSTIFVGGSCYVVSEFLQHLNS